MFETLIDHPKLRVSVKTGSEGPRHDPYAFKEITVVQPDGTTVLHEGLGVWLRSSGRKVKPPASMKYEDQERWCRSTAFVTLTGYTIEQLERMNRKLKSRCRKCGSREVEYQNGFPGEHFECCAKCGNVLSTHFNISEVE
jgi:hypothetical protein